MRKRSGSLRLTTMLAGAVSLSLTACSEEPTATAGWDREAINSGEHVEALGYGSVAECKADGKVPAATCDEAAAAALKDDATHAPRFDTQATCETVYGLGNCQPNQVAGQGSGQGAGSFFTPILAGFVIGRMMSGGGQPYYRGTGLYREERCREENCNSRSGGYYTGWGGRLSRSYETGRLMAPRAGIEPPAALSNAPPRIQTRSYVASRGGFGGGHGRGYGG